MDGRSRSRLPRPARTLSSLLGALGLLLTACGGSSPGTLTVQPARIFRLSGLQPHSAVRAGRSTLVSFTIKQPSGAALTAYKTGGGPHTGVDLIIVRSDLGVLLYEDTDIAADGRITQPVTFPSPGRYRIIVDAYPTQTGAGSALPRNFQLFTWIRVRGMTRSQPLPPFSPIVHVDGYRFMLHGRPHLHAIEPAFLTVTVRDPQGRPTVFSPWRGALAHAIFIRERSLDYFHTHVCSPGATSCTSILGATKVTGTSTTPGKLTVGVLVPVAGTWRLFLLVYVDGRNLTAPFILHVS